MAAPLPVVPPANIANMPANSRYMIAYDFSTHRIEDAPPQGWGKTRHFCYDRVIRNLAGSNFVRDQYSMYQRNNVSGAHTYTAMVNMTRANIMPIAFVSSTISGLCMTHQPHVATMDVSNDVKIGGALTGANPAGAIVPTGLVPPAVIHHWHPAGQMPALGRVQFAGANNDYMAT